ncbi:MAG: universal stress protein [Bacteroidales bacterium]|nr:MAG: universal stress protein [Bacteroidales bacterium]
MDSEIITLLTLENSQAAYFLKGHLDSSGIESFLSFVEGTTSEVMKKKQGIKVKVRENDVEEAIRIILEITGKYGKLEDQQAHYFRRILVPVDFTDTAVKASQLAIGLAENLHGEIRLLHVYDDPLIKDHRIKKTSTFEKYQEEKLLQIEDECQQRIVVFTKQLKEKIDPERFTRAKIHFSMSIGLMESEIIHVCDRYKPEVIVLGIGRGDGRINHLTENLAVKVAGHVKIPLLVVPEETEIWRVDHIKVLYATDFLDSDFTSFRKLLGLMAPFNVEFSCIHVENEDDNTLKVQKMHELQEVIDRDYGNYSIKLRLIKNEDMINGIMEFVEKENIHIISFTNPRRSMIYRLLSPNNLKRMILESKVPMFIFHT